MFVQSRNKIRPRAFLLVLFAASKLLAQDPDKSDVATGIREIQDIEHRLTSATVNGITLDLPEYPPLSISFHEDGKISGRSGVNQYFGGIELASDGAFRWVIPEFATTRTAGDPKLMRLEAEFLEGLRNTRTIRIAGELISISSDDGAAILNFAKGTVEKAIVSLQDVELMLVRFVLDGKDVQLPKRAKVTFRLHERTRFTGQSPVNTYSGSFDVKSDGHLHFLRLTEATQRAGDPEAMDLEGAYFSALTRVQRLKPLVNGLILESEGKTVFLEFRAQKGIQ